MALKSKDNMINIFTEDAEPFSDIMDQNNNALKSLHAAKDLGFLPTALASPLYVLWEITSRCPQNCIYCYNNSPRKVNELSSRRLFTLADELISARVFSVCVSGGEPTARPEYIDLIKYLATGQVSVNTILSGANINKENARIIAKYVSNIQVSLDGSCSEIHDAVRARKGSFDDAVNAIRLLTAHGATVSVSFAITQKNYHDFPKVHELCTQLGVKSLRTQKLTVSGKVKGSEDNICVSEEEYQQILEYIRKRDRSMCMIEYADQTQHISSGRDVGMATMARITSEGNLAITPYLDVYFGNLAEESFATCWNRMKNGWINPILTDILDNVTEFKNQVLYDRLNEYVYVQGGIA